MISSLDYLDNDVSNVLSDFINVRRNYDNVIKDLKVLINVNILAKYLTSFDNYNSNCYNYFNKEQDILRLAYNLITEKKKTRWLHNWPTKPTSFVPWNWTYKQLLIKKSNEDYIIGTGHWKLKKFPPNKNKYSLNRLLIVKFKKQQV